MTTKGNSRIDSLIKRGIQEEKIRKEKREKILETAPASTYREVPKLLDGDIPSTTLNDQGILVFNEI